MRPFFRRRPAQHTAERLTDCPLCAADCVNPTAWEQNDDGSWWMRLRCGACGTMRELTVPDDEAQRYDRQLDRGMNAIAAVVRRLDREHMAREVETLAEALRLDLLDAGDFALRPGHSRA
jgi:transcription elongation factor Elf1